MTILNVTTNAFSPFLRRGFRTKSVVDMPEASTADVELGCNELWPLAGDHRWQAIVCLQGELWVTQSRDFHDYLLAAGEMFIISQPGTVVVQAREPSRLQVTPSLATPAYAGDSAKTIFR